MIEGKTVLAVIPARGGSKRVPRKNLKDFRGRPLILWSITEARKSKYIDILAVSSEDREIQLLSSPLTTVIHRPHHLAEDDSTSEDVLLHALTVYSLDWVVLLQPTSPLRTVEDIDGCIERAQLGEVCISVDWETRKTNGAIYVCKADWLKAHNFRDVATMKYVMPKERGLDINDPCDFEA